VVATLKNRPVASQQRVILIGKENTGKTQLAAAMTGGLSRSSNLRGSTVAVERYRTAEWEWIDTPGIVRQSDSRATALTLERLADDDAAVVLVVQATHLDEELRELLPLVTGRSGLIVATYWDKVEANDATLAALHRLSKEIGAVIVPVDARDISDERRLEIEALLRKPGFFQNPRPTTRVGWRIEPRPTLIERAWLGPLAAAGLLLAPAVAAVWFANTFAGLVDPLVQDLMAPAADTAASWPAPLSDVLAGDYGLLTMGPLLFVWAIPTVMLYAFLLAAYKTTGLLERISVAVHPLVRPFGLAGRDVARVVMGFGCNVPAVIGTRACSGCTRQTTISAIAFGSACSYQFGATLAVFSAARLPWLVLPYLLYLTITTLAYSRMVAPAEARSALNLLVTDGRTFLTRPNWRAVWREAWSTLRQFFVTALPIFAVITVVAALLAWSGVIERLARLIDPVMAVFRLPAEAVIPVLLASIRKDGLLLFDEPSTLASLSALQLLTGVYLAGVLLPCLVTALTISREQSVRFTLGLLGRQAAAAVGFTLLLAWGGSALLAFL
jgi:Fe2+ transport system protein B